MLIFGGFFSCLLPMFRQTQNQNIIPLTSSLTFQALSITGFDAKSGIRGVIERMNVVHPIFHKVLLRMVYFHVDDWVYLCLPPHQAWEPNHLSPFWIDFDMSRAVVHPLSRATVLSHWEAVPLVPPNGATAMESEWDDKSSKKPCTPRIQWCETSLYAIR